MKATEMTLRDWFAGQALIGLTTDAGRNVTQLDIAKAAWAISEKMMKTRPAAIMHPCPNIDCSKPVGHPGECG